MGWNMWAPSGVNFDTKEDKDKLIRVREIDDGRFKVHFMTQSRGQRRGNDKLIDWGFGKSQHNKETSDNHETTSVYSTKAGTVKDINKLPDNASNYTNLNYFPRSHICDDWEFLEENYWEIKAIWIYASYYIKAIKVVYETNDMNTITTLHSAKDFDPEKEAKLSYREMELDEGEFVERINVIKSTQNGLIRNITIGTNFERNMWVEGEIEVHDIFELEPEKRAKLEDEDTQRLIAVDSNTIVDEVNESETNSILYNMKKSMNMKSIALEGDNEIYDLDKLTIRKQSVIDGDDKTHSCNLKFVNHFLVGFKTRFNDEYLEDIELYTEQNEDIKINMIDSSPGKARFLFV